MYLRYGLRFFTPGFMQRLSATADAQLALRLVSASERIKVCPVLL